METTIEFHETVENVSISFEEITDIVSIEFIETLDAVENLTITFEEITDSVSIEINETLEVAEIVFEELGVPGVRGKSAYEIAVENGFVGTEENFLNSLKGEQGDLSVLGNYERDWASDFLVVFNT